jgi:hypothetical protein
MIPKRHTARNRRIDSRTSKSKTNSKAEINLAARAGAQFEHFFSEQQHRAAWSEPIGSYLADFHTAFQRDAARAMRPTPPDLLRQLRATRREKIANKTREREREARGEVPRTAGRASGSLRTCWRAGRPRYARPTCLRGGVRARSDTWAGEACVGLWNTRFSSEASLRPLDRFDVGSGWRNGHRFGSPTGKEGCQISRLHFQ